MTFRRWEHNLREENGFTLIEVMLSMVIFSMIALAIVQTYVMYQRYWLDSSRTISLQSTGRIAVEAMTRRIRNAADAAITDDNSETILDITETSGNTMAYTFDKTDKVLKFDDDVSSSNDEKTILLNVDQIGSQPVFQISGSKMISINLRVRDPDGTDGYQGRDFSVIANWRNG